MIGSPLPLLTRLRPHRGAWLLLAVAIMFKLVSSSICVGDVPGFAADTQAVTLLDQAGDGEDGCLLGEGAGCHCNCMHSVALPIPTALHVVRVAPDAALAQSVSFVVVFPAPTPLRPPIA
ncbi:hypothetical protein [Dyella sp.]|uniref:hypothetical protein n=1 Tax=Dyella sp. TaxID=1869338 RepID=UPI002ED0196A